MAHVVPRTVFERIRQITRSPLNTIKYLRGEGVEVIIYEPTLADGSDFNGFEIENDFAKHSKRSDIIIANRLEDELKKSLRQGIHARFVRERLILIHDKKLFIIFLRDNSIFKRELNFSQNLRRIEILIIGR